MYQKIRLLSKKNKVYRIIKNSKSLIVKEFSDLDRMKKELQLLKLLNQSRCSVPEIISTKDNKLYMEDLGNTTLLDCYECMEKENTTNYIDMIETLCNWLKAFYSITSNYFDEKYILYDVNYRNFIIKDKKIYGIDFEESRIGKIEVDAGKLLAYALTYNPMMTKWKKKFADKLLNILSFELGIDRELIIKQRDKEFEQIEIRRKY